MTVITSKDYTGTVRTLTRKDGTPVNKGDTINNFRGEPRVILAGYAPHKPASTGFIDTDAGYYNAQVCNLEWK